MKALTIQPLRPSFQNSNHSSPPKQVRRTGNNWLWIPWNQYSWAGRISTLMSTPSCLERVLLYNIDVFAWTHSNMTGIIPTHASHKLNVISSAKPIKQRIRHFHPDRHQVIHAKVDNLLKAGFIREIKYPEWLANVVVVPKKGGKWRVCVDYTDLNDACHKDNFPLPRIDQIIDSSVRHGMLSFLDAFSGYHHIPMYSPDAEKTAFITPTWTLLL